MTISSQTIPVIRNGNGAATVFSFSPMTIVDNTWLKVYKRGAGGGFALLSEGGGGAQYTINVSEYPGTGTVTYPSQGSVRLETGEKLIFIVQPPFTQQEDLENQEGYFPEVQEAALDKLTQITQYLNEEVSRSLKVPVDTPNNVSTTLPLPAANKYIRWSSDATQLINVDGPTEGGGGGDPDPDPEPPVLSGTVLLDDGSVSAPSLTFSNDPDTGLYRNSSSGALQVTMDGARTVSINKDGTVGLSLVPDGNPVLRTIPVTDQTKRVNITGSIGSSYPKILAGGASPGNTSILVGAEPEGHGSFLWSGVTPAGIQVINHGVTKDVAVDQATNIQSLAEWLSTEYGGGTLIFTQGDYYIMKACNIPSNISIKGEGRVRFMMGKQGILRCAGTYAFDESLPNARLRSGTSSGTNVWHIDTDHSGGDITRFTTGSKWRVRGAGGGDIEVRDRMDVTVASTDGVDDVTTVQDADVTYLVSWDPNVFPEAAAYEALYGETDYTYMDKFVMTLLLNDADRGVDQTINIATTEAAPYVEGGYYLLADDQEELDVAGTLHNRGNIEIVYVSKKEDMGSNVTKLTLAQPVSRTFKVTDGAALYQMDWTVNIFIDNIDFVSYDTPDPAPASRVPVLEFRFTINFKGSNLRFNGKAADQAGRRGNIFRVYYCAHGGFEDCMASWPGYSGSGEGYLFSLYNSRDVFVDKCVGIGGRHNFLSQVGTDVRFTSCVSYDCLISDFDCHGVNEVGIVISDCIIKQSRQRSDGSNTSVAAIRLGNTAHPLGCRDVTISNINIFGDGTVENRGIDIVPPASNISISGVYMSGVYDGIYCRSNLDEDLVASNIRISDIRMDNVVRYGIALLGNADAGFTGYQIADVTLDGISVRNTNRPLIAAEVNGLAIQNIDAKGVGTGTAQTAFDCNDILDLRASNIIGIDLYRGWSLTSCPSAFIQFYWEGLSTNNVLVDGGGNTAMELVVFMKDGQNPGINTTGTASTDRVITTPGRSRGKVVTDAAYTVLREDLGNTIIGNSSAGTGNTEFTIPSTILRCNESGLVGTQNGREMGVIYFVNINTDDMEIVAGSNVTVVLPGGFTVLTQGKRATATIVRTGASTLSVYVTEG